MHLSALSRYQHPSTLIQKPTNALELATFTDTYYHFLAISTLARQRTSIRMLGIDSGRSILLEARRFCIFSSRLIGHSLGVKKDRQLSNTYDDKRCLYA